MAPSRQARARGGRPGSPSQPTPGGTADETPDADPESVARSIVLRQLTMAPRSRQQLADKLAQRGAPDDVAERVLDRFESVGLVDDAAFADMLIRSQVASRGLGRRGLAHELRRKGVDDETARAALEQVDDDDEAETARALVARKVRATRGLDRDKRMARLAGMLARKGYPSGLTMTVVREALDADAAATGHPERD
ncbi:regulatory protein RecX [Angustibacter luteus]|uniref:Regulatory protein RecX n=1 Tax=Angustibacter luteus TaxID=658456 RepID=A0ABW1J9I1_9ACTN